MHSVARSDFECIRENFQCRGLLVSNIVCDAPDPLHETSISPLVAPLHAVNVEVFDVHPLYHIRIPVSRCAPRVHVGETQRYSFRHDKHPVLQVPALTGNVPWSSIVYIVVLVADLSVHKAMTSGARHIHAVSDRASEFTANGWRRLYDTQEDSIVLMRCGS